MKLNLGSGTRPKKGWVNVEKFEHEGVDLYHDLNEIPYPIKSNSADEILLDNVFEHLAADTTEIMKELHRIMRKGALLTIIVPHYTNPSAYMDDHRKVFSSVSFRGYMKHHGYNRIYDFSFIADKVTIQFTKGLLWFPNALIEYIANKFGILKMYEGTVLSAFPAKSIKFEMVKSWN